MDKNCLPIQGTWGLTLRTGLEDPTYHGATEPMHHNYWSGCITTPKPGHLAPALHNRSHCSEGLCAATVIAPAHCN